MKAEYRQHCADEPTLPLFSTDWWLDAVAGPAGWDVALAGNGQGIQASMPFTYRRKFGLTVSTQPQLTQCLGPWLRHSAAKSAKRLSRQKHLLEELIRQLPKTDYFMQKWHHSQTNWLPFHWAGFQQTTRYTYVLPGLRDLDQVWDGFDQSIRTDIRKAESRHGLTIKSQPDIESFIRLNRLVFKRQGRSMPYSESLVRRIDAACGERSQRRIFIAVDGDGRPHAGVYLVWDGMSAYYLLGGGDPALRNSGATSYCMWSAIQFAATVVDRFDFEGSMIPAVERFVRSFGAEQVPYFQIKRFSSRALSALDAFRNAPRPALGGGGE